MTLHRDSSFSSVRLHCVSYRAKYNRCSVLLEDIEYLTNIVREIEQFRRSGHEPHDHWRPMPRMGTSAHLGRAPIAPRAHSRKIRRGEPWGSPQHYGPDGRLQARGGRWRKQFGPSLCAWRPRPRCSAASTTSSESSMDEVSTGGIALEALSRPDSSTCSSTSNRAA